MFDSYHPSKDRKVDPIRAVMVRATDCASVVKRRRYASFVRGEICQQCHFFFVPVTRKTAQEPGIWYYSTREWVLNSNPQIN